MTDNREQQLQALAAENARWAEAERQLIKAIQEHKARLKRLPEIIQLLPGIIQGLKEEKQHVTAEMLRTGAEHDALEAEVGDGPCNGCVVLKRDRACPSKKCYDAKFHAWANGMADDYSDHKLAVQPPAGW